MRCGGSEKKKKSRPSTAYGLGTLCISSFLWLCNLMSRRFIDAPSEVVPMTCIEYINKYVHHIN